MDCTYPVRSCVSLRSVVVASALLMSALPAVSAANTRPQISGTPATSVVVNQAYAFRPSASDQDGDTLTFRISNKPGWAAFDKTTGRLSGKPTIDRDFCGHHHSRRRW